MSIINIRNHFIKYLRFWDWKKYFNFNKEGHDFRNVLFKMKKKPDIVSNIIFILNGKEDLLNAIKFIDENNKNVIEYEQLKKIWKYLLPKNFEWEQYKNLYTDLLTLEEDEVTNHYLLYGNYEKRIYRKILIPEKNKIPLQREITYDIKLLSSPMKIAYLKKKEEEEKKRHQEKEHKKIKRQILLENLRKQEKEEKRKKHQEDAKQDSVVSKTDTQCKNITIIICFNSWYKEKWQEALRLFKSLNKQTYKNYNVFIAIKHSILAAYFLKENIRNLKDFIIIEEEFNYKNIFCSIKNHANDHYLIILDIKDYFLSKDSLKIINKVNNVNEFITWEGNRENSFCIYSNIFFTRFLNNFKSNTDFINNLFRDVNRYHIPEKLVESKSIIARNNISKINNEINNQILPYFSKDSFYNTYLKDISEIPIFYINLDRSKDRNDAILKNILKTQELFDSKNIKLDVNRVSGVDGTKKENLNNLFINKIITVKKDTELGCLCSHLLSIKTAYEKGHNFAIILEDDIDLTPLFYNYDLFLEATKYLHDSHEIIQTYVINEIGNCNSNYNYCSPFLKWHFKYWSTASYIITRNGMKNIIDFFFEGDKIKNVYMNIFVADLLLYSFCDTITSSIPLCNILPVNSLIQQNYEPIQSNAIIECNVKNEEIKTLYNINRIPFSDDILKGDYLIFTSMGDNSHNAYRRWNELIKESNLKIDLVIYYYGDNHDTFNEIKDSCDLAVMRKGLKFDNLFYFFQTYRDNLDLSNYKRVAVLDDDIDLKCDNHNPLDRLFLLSDLFDVYISGPSCSTTAKNHILTWWKQTHHNEDTLCHFSNFIETNTPIFRMDCLTYLMNVCYKYKKIPSWGSDLFFINMLGFELSNKYLIIDDVQFINPTLEKKNVTVREIDTYCPEKIEEEKWLKIAKKYNLKHTVNNYTLNELSPKYKVYSKNFKISNIKHGISH